jgi:RNase P subunit RPR2
MRSHVKHHHEGKERLVCHACEKTYISKAALEYHVRKEHSNEAEIKCDKCNETFHNFSGYATHRRSHKSVFFQLEQSVISETERLCLNYLLN